MNPNLTTAFAEQARSCTALGSPFMAALMAAMPASWVRDGALDRACAPMTGDVGPQAAAVPLRIAAGLHLAARTGQDAVLARIYARLEHGRLSADLPGIMARLDVDLAAAIHQVPQTNEVGRSAVLIAAARELAALHPGPMTLWELGASAGLNLLFDCYHLSLDDGPAQDGVDLRPVWSGPAPPDVPLTVVARRGVDLNPLSPVTDRDRLLSYIWPDQPARLARMSAALRLAAAAPPQVDRDRAGNWLAARLAESAPKGTIRLIFHTIAVQYFPQEEQDRIDQLLADATVTPDSPIARIGMEPDGGTGAVVTLQIWPGGAQRQLGRAGFHGEWVDWRGPG